MSIDPRLAERRKAVAEGHAHHSIGRLLRFLLGAVIMAGLAWLAFSPWLSVSQVRTAGIHSSEANAILVENRVVAGTPMIMLRPGSVEAALEEDPWIRGARVHLDWPNQVIVRVEERVPVAWVETAGGWTRRGVDGISVPSGSVPDNSLPWLRLPHLADDGASQSGIVIGAIEFLAELPDAKIVGATVWLEGSELWAVVDGHEVRLGRPVEMTAKAHSLVALLGESVPDDAILVLIAPAHPAVRPPVAEESPNEDQNEDSEEQP